jgi:hypothetical protein
LPTEEEPLELAPAQEREQVQELVQEQALKRQVGSMTLLRRRIRPAGH